MSQAYIYIGLLLMLTLIVALIICCTQWLKIRKNKKSLEGFLETERLIKERFQKENGWLFETKENSQKDYDLKIIAFESKVAQLEAVIQRMDEDILLLQKSNEDTEALLMAGEPVVNSLRLKLDRS